MEIRIQKAKITAENRIEIKYQQKNQTGGWNEFSLSCIEQAEPEFYTALSALAADVVEMCEQPESYIDRIKVRGVSYSYGGDAEVMGATISAGMTLLNSNCPLNMNTPHKASDSYNDGPADEKQLLSGDCFDRLRSLHSLAERYVKGTRAQGDLFADTTSAGESVTVTGEQLEAATH